MTDPRPWHNLPDPAAPVPAPGLAPRKSRAGLYIGLAVTGVVIVMLCCIGTFAAALGADDDEPTEPASTTGASTVADPPTSARSSAPYTPPAAAYVPTTADFALTVNVTGKKCFGSAGCLVDYTISVAYTGPAGSMRASDTWALTYRLEGAEQEQIVTITIRGTTVSSREESTQTAHEYDVLTAVVTGLRKA